MAFSFSIDGWSGMQDEAFSLSPEQLAALASDETKVVKYPDRAVHRLLVNGRCIYAKWLYPGKKGIIPGIKRLIRGPRVKHIWRIHGQLAAAGFGCAQPLLAAWKQDWTELFVSKAVEAQPLDKALASASPEKAAELVQQAAVGLRSLHQAGFIHGDAIPGNICFDANGRFYLLDNDRTKQVGGLFLPHAAWRNVIQFCSHLPLHNSAKELQRLFLDAYSAGSFSEARLKAMEQKIQQRSLVVAAQLAERRRRRQAESQH